MVLTTATQMPSVQTSKSDSIANANPATQVLGQAAKTLMSAAQAPMTATQMRFAPTQTAVSSAHASRATLEMEPVVVTSMNAA